MSSEKSWSDPPNPNWKIGQKLSENETNEGKAWFKAVNEYIFKAWNPEDMEPAYVVVHAIGQVTKALSTEMCTG
jgi:hypothetical protein